jgi:hypothetical protein
MLDAGISMPYLLQDTIFAPFFHIFVPARRKNGQKQQKNKQGKITTKAATNRYNH